MCLNRLPRSPLGLDLRLPRRPRLENVARDPAKVPTVGVEGSWSHAHDALHRSEILADGGDTLGLWRLRPVLDKRSLNSESEKIRINARRDPRRRFLVPGSRGEGHPSALELNLDEVVRGATPLPEFSGLKPETGIAFRKRRNLPLHFPCTFLV